MTGKPCLMQAVFEPVQPLTRPILARILTAVLAGLLAGLAGCKDNTSPDAATASASIETFSVVEASIPEIQAALAAGHVSSRQLVEQYLQRIGMYEIDLRATMAVNPDALAIADELDRERAEGKLRGPLHGIPIALKDNIHTTDMPTTGGAIAFEAFTPPYEATIVKNLRDAGAIIFAKTTLTELANWVATGMPDNYNALRGYAMNPYEPRNDPRAGFNDGRPVMSPGGSSSGIGTAVSFWAASVGTQTSGSLVIPSNNNRLVGIDPTIGRLSRHGIIPITMDQDSAGPMARTVAGAAIMLGAMENPGNKDRNDPAIGLCKTPTDHDFTPYLKKDGLSGKRIGIPRAFFYEAVTPPGQNQARGGLSTEAATLMAEAITVLRQQGAEVVDPVEIPSHVATNADDNQLLFGNCYDVVNARGKDDNCSVVMKYGMKRDFNKWLASLGDAAPVASLAALREFNLANSQRNAIKYEQAELDISDEMDVERDRQRYQADRAKDLRLTRTQGIDAVLKEHDLDALFVPSWFAENIADKAGYPQIIVPYGSTPYETSPPLPAGFDAAPLPYGVTFVGTACSEPKLIEMAYGFEQATLKRVPPPAFP